MYMGDQSYYVVQAVPDTQAKTLFIVSAFIGDQGYSGKIKKGTSQLNDASAPPRTSKTDFVIVPTNRIHQNEPEVNTSEEKNITKADLREKTSVAKRDSKYLSAVERGDMKTAQRMVDEAAKAAGYTVKAYHGTPSTVFTKFDNDTP